MPSSAIFATKRMQKLGALLRSREQHERRAFVSVAPFDPELLPWTKSVGLNGTPKACHAAWKRKILTVVVAAAAEKAAAAAAAEKAAAAQAPTVASEAAAAPAAAAPAAAATAAAAAIIRPRNFRGQQDPQVLKEELKRRAASKPRMRNQKELLSHAQSKL